MRRWQAVLLTGCWCLASPPARAQDRVAAEALFDAGKQLMEAGDFAQACPKLEQSQKLDPAVGTLLYLGECFEKLGRTASAWATFREAASAAQAAGQGERARIGRDRAARLFPQLVRLTVIVAPSNLELAGFAVLRDGRPLDPGLFGEALPVDPGEHVVEATAPGREPFRITLRTDQAGKTERVEVPPLALAAQPPPAAHPPERPVARTATETRPREPVTSRPDAPPEEPGGTQRTVGWVIGAAGVLGLGVGGYFGLRAFDRNDEAQKLCPRSPDCTSPRAITLTEEAQDAALLSNVSFGVGAALLATGVVVVVFAPGRAEPSREGPAALRRQVRLAPVLAAGGGGLWLVGGF